MTQTVIACTILLISSFYVFRLLTRALSKKRSGCGSCGCGDKGKQPSSTKEKPTSN